MFVAYFQICDGHDHDVGKHRIHLLIVITGNNTDIISMFTLDDVDFISAAAVIPKVFFCST